MKFLAVFVLCILQKTEGVIYTLNETEYDGLPPLFQLDEFYPCLRRPGDVYCYVDALLVSSNASELLNIIQEYSENHFTHFDHNYIHRGVCVTKTCRDHVSNTTDLNTSIEACLNSTLTRTHQLQARLVKDKVICSKYEEPMNIDAGDVIVAVVFIAILVLNLLGTWYDFCCHCRSKTTLAGTVLRCFSVKRNWRRLVAPSGEGPEPRLRRLKCFNGIKSFTTFFVVMGHAPLAAVLITNNPQFLETTYHNPIYHIFYNGTLIVQSFFILSGFLLAYNILIMEEKKRVSWEMLPKGIIMRWLRLTPPYAAVLAFVSTWLRHIGNGPMWKSAVVVEVDDCRRDWFYNLVYINNYIDHSQCMAHTWYLASDMQLSVVGLVIFCLLSGARARKIAIALAFVVGLATPAIHTFFQNLHAILLLTPEVARHFFVEDPTFNNLYKRGHTNLVSYAMGLALGLWVYRLEQNNIDVQKFKKYRFVYWATVPFGLLVIVSGGIFYIDGINVPLEVRVLYSSIIKPLFGLIGFILVPGTIFKLEKIYRGILEWRGWAPVGRISYCAYLVHVIMIRTSTGNQTSLIHSNFYQIFLNYVGLLGVTYIAAAPCWMLIEAPFAQLVKVCLNPGPKVAPEEKKISTALFISRKELDGLGGRES